MLGMTTAHAQLGNTGALQPMSRDQPVFYQADAVEYDRDGAMVTLTGHVEIWQGDRVMRADRVTYDRNTGVAAASGNVALVEPTGQVVFADYAELSEGMKDGILRDLRALLPQNGRLAANGARRTDGTINELSRVIYSTCNLCATDPSSPPLWDIRARSALQDTENKKIEYRDAVVDFYGQPVFYFPFIAHPDPSERRANGILVPSAGYSGHLGGYFDLPYYWVIDGQKDVTLTPVLSTKQGGGLNVDYRQVFNNGKLTLRGAIASDEGSIAGYVFTRGDFSIDDTWRWGFDINRASSVDYMRDYRVPGGLVPVLASQVWIEGFGQGAYSRLDMRAYQSIVNSNYLISRLPYVLPRYQYSYFGEPDTLGGRFSLTGDAFNLQREAGTNTQRARLSLDWQRPFTGQLGDLWKLTFHVDSAVYSASNFTESPNFGSSGSVQSSQAMPTGALEVRWPLVRDAGSWGTQTVEPRVQLVVGPNGSKYGRTTLANGTTVSTSKIPNEDSFDQELSDANLFALNRFPGVDRLEGGVRVNAALRAGWRFPTGAALDGMVGESYRVQKGSPWWTGSGLENQASDIVSRVTFSPTSRFDITARTRFDPNKSMMLTLADAQASVGPPAFRLNGGYLLSSINPFFTYDYAPTGIFWGATGKESPTQAEPYAAPRSELSLGFNTRYGAWHLSGSARANIRTHDMDSFAISGYYEDECSIFALTFYKRYTSIANDHGDQVVLFQITLKTVGQFGFHPM